MLKHRLHQWLSYGLLMLSLAIQLAQWEAGTISARLGQAETKTYTHTEPSQQVHQVVVHLPAPLAAQKLTSGLLVSYGAGESVPAQIVAAGLADDPQIPAYVVCIIPRWDRRQPLVLSWNKAAAAFSGQYRFHDQARETVDVLWQQGDVVRPVLQYVYRRHNPADHYFTFKPFHHLYDPVDGKKLLTSGATRTAREGLFPHHRGLFFGFNRISYGEGQSADIWHGTQGVYSQHEEFVEKTVGPVLARHRSRIGWYGRDGRMFAQEEREVSVYAVAGGTLLDWSTRLTTQLPQVRLDGDPQHAGFHFRAAQEVAASGKANTYYVRPDGKGKPGETRNWEPKKPDPRTINLPWGAMSFVVDGRRYTVLRIGHPDNPGPTRGSERDYGRFGDYFEYTLTPDKPLLLRYRLWVQAGEMTPEQCAALADGFRQPPRVSWMPQR